MNKEFTEVESVSMTVGETATYIGVSKGMIYKYVKMGKIPHFRKGNQIFIDLEKLNNWIDSEMDKNYTMKPA